MSSLELCVSLAHQWVGLGSLVVLEGASYEASSNHHYQHLGVLGIDPGLRVLYTWHTAPRW